MPVDLKDRGQSLENDYFRRQEQEILEKMRAKLEAENAQEVSAKCPQKGCDCDMKEVDFENIKIDVCEKCGGVWLDPNELAQLMKKENEVGNWFTRLFD